MKVTEVGTQRFNVALELMREGHSLNFNDVYFYLGNDGILDVSVDASKIIEEITKDSASEDMERAVATMSYLKDNSSEFALVVKDYKPEFVLCSNDGTCVVELARLVGDKIVWSHGLPSPVA